jgi:hypothetical protein
MPKHYRVSAIEAATVIKYLSGTVIVIGCISSGLNAGIFRWPAEGDTSTMVLNGEELSCPD